MTAMAWVIVALIIVPTTYIVWSVVSVDRRGYAAIRSNLSRGRSVLGDLGAGIVPTSEIKQSVPLGLRVTPKGYAAWLDKLLAKAGRPTSLPLDRLLMAKPALALIAAALTIMILLKTPSGATLLLTIFVTALAYFVPDILIHGRGAERQKAIELELPNTLDQMLISVEAGLGFEAAMARACHNGKGALAAELARTLQDMQVGRTRKDAYISMAERTGVPDLRSFVSAIVQADIYGIAIANVLRSQAKQMRIKRRQRAEEKAMKLPVKVLFPLMFCILPALFIVIIGPAIIKVMSSISGAF
ncbi:type II secretion system F family protein (plasmid) [Arthrobacter sp. YA7-1]|uniref:type II secretion system F family protein n=1 Tax=Arthrobacter sp. YA7-1 TaxID=2987701 RepID=UPI00222768C7|nr:type II secretion system F family protein [Arthrobacter sp. YA7-1]UYY83726.1 type II secretion system F family protein [Arthrobacter sp. YA7-1]